jgi:hypothetical protein
VDGKHHDVSTERIVHEIGAWPMRSKLKLVRTRGYCRDEDGFIFCNRHLFRLGMFFLWTFATESVHRRYKLSRPMRWIYRNLSDLWICAARTIHPDSTVGRIARKASGLFVESVHCIPDFRNLKFYSCGFSFNQLSISSSIFQLHSSIGVATDRQRNRSFMRRHWINSGHNHSRQLLRKQRINLHIVNRCAHNFDGVCVHAEASAMYGNRPSPGVCSVCAKYEGPPRGLGDAVHSFAVTLGLDRVVESVVGDCGCAQRRAALNAALPFTDEARKDG